MKKHEYAKIPKIGKCRNVRNNVYFDMQVVKNSAKFRFIAKNAIKNQNFSNNYRKFRTVSQNRGFDSRQRHIFFEIFFAHF